MCVVKLSSWLSDVVHGAQCPTCTTRGRERGPCFTIAWSGCVHLAPQAPQAPLWLAAHPRLRRASRLRQACQVMLNPLRPPPPPPPSENCHSWSHPRACWETLILSCCDHKPTSFGGLLVSSMRPIHKVICILLGGISSVVLINSERSPLVGAGTASLGGRLWSCTVSMMRASRVSLLTLQHPNRTRSTDSRRFLNLPLSTANTCMSEQHRALGQQGVKSAGTVALGTRPPDPPSHPRSCNRPHRSPPPATSALSPGVNSKRG